MFLDVLVPVVVFVIIAFIGAGAGEAGDATTAVLFLVYIVFALYLFAHGTTPGKKLLGMTVVKESGVPAGFGRMLLRELIGKWISGFVFGLGYIWILVDRANQGWHDKLVNTFVVEE